MRRELQKVLKKTFSSGDPIMTCEPNAQSVTALTEFYGDASQQGIPPACPDPASVRPWVWRPWQAAEKQKDLKNKYVHRLSYLQLRLFPSVSVW